LNSFYSLTGALCAGTTLHVSRKCVAQCVAHYDQRSEQMRTVMFSMIMAVGIGMSGWSSASAAPANGVAIGNAALAADSTQNVGWGHRGGGRGLGGRGFGGSFGACRLHRC
jgi:hypothetical protein